MKLLILQTHLKIKSVTYLSLLVVIEFTLHQKMEKVLIIQPRQDIFITGM